MNRYLKLNFILIIIVLLVLPALGMVKEKKEQKDAYIFKIENQINATPIKSQGRTGTCWIFATHSFLESEVLRKGGPEIDLSEMYIARHAYTDKARQYVLMHGSANFGPGGQSHDVIDQMKKFGLVPEEVYTGMLEGQKNHNHGELGSVLGSMLDAILKRRGGSLTTFWDDALEAVLDVYLGSPLEKFKFKGKEYTPKSFMEDFLKINPNDYIEITSYTHHPFYQKCRLEIPDNWSYNNDYYNIPMDDLVNLVYNTLKKGYTFAWDADVSEKYFSNSRIDVSLIPQKDWDDKTRKEREEKIKNPITEKKITQKMRQETFENWTTTDDHLMHIIGTAKDQNDNKYFYMKNSWGTDRQYKGYFYVSEAYFRLKTICIMIHKDALSTKLKGKLGL